MNLLFQRKILGSNRKTVKGLISDMMRSINLWNALAEDEEFEFRLILNELISNGITHGNEKCDHKTLIASIREVDKYTISICIEDEGRGFNHSNCLQEKHHLYMEGGRGLKIIKELCDDMQFYCNGSHIEVCKSIKK